MGMTIQTSMLKSQFRSPLPETNPNISRSNNMEKRKTLKPKRNFRPVTPKVTTTNPPIPQAPPKPNYEVPPTVVRADTPWPGTGKTSGNLPDDRQWFLPKGYPAILNKKNDTNVPSLKEKLKAEKPVIADNPKEDKCRWGPDCPFCKAQERKKKAHNTGPYQTHKPRN